MRQLGLIRGVDDAGVVTPVKRDGKFRLLRKTSQHADLCWVQCDSAELLGVAVLAGA